MPRYYSKLGSNGNLELAVAFLTAKNAKTPQQEETTYYQTVLPGSDRYISVGSQADANVIDLTGDDKDDLQRAIALSLAESNRAFRETGMTDEEQAISRSPNEMGKKPENISDGLAAKGCFVKVEKFTKQWNEIIPLFRVMHPLEPNFFITAYFFIAKDSNMPFSEANSFCLEH
nr:ubiquitin carboxyl-terminal hydrolase 25-like isoform X2 [Equus asinus]